MDSLIMDDECFTQIVQYFKLVVEIDISETEIKRLLNEMVDEGYITVNYSWQNEHYEYPYSLTRKGRIAWDMIEI